MTEDYAVQKQFVRLRGLGLMADILVEYGEDNEIATLVCLVHCNHLLHFLTRLQGFAKHIKLASPQSYQD